jgi:hypothetical protein
VIVESFELIRFRLDPFFDHGRRFQVPKCNLDREFQVLPPGYGLTPNRDVSVRTADHLCLLPPISITAACAELK